VGKPETLRGRGQFSVVLARGKRIHGKLVRASYCAVERPGTRLRVGIAVARRVAGAVTRNRIRRLIREAVRLEESAARMELEQSGVSIDLVLGFVPLKDVDLRRMSLLDVLPDIRNILATIVTRSDREHR